MSKDDLTTWTKELQEQVLDEARIRYTERALTHWQTPHNFKPSPAGSVSGKLTGPCGDTIEIWLALREDRIGRAGFLTDGCSSSIMCGSAAARIADGMSIMEARGVTPQAILDELGGLPELEQHCALLAYLVLADALDSVTTLG